MKKGIISKQNFKLIDELTKKNKIYAKENGNNKLGKYLAELDNWFDSETHLKTIELVENSEAYEIHKNERQKHNDHFNPLISKLDKDIKDLQTEKEKLISVKNIWLKGIQDEENKERERLRNELSLKQELLVREYNEKLNEIITLLLDTSTEHPILAKGES